MSSGLTRQFSRAVFDKKADLYCSLSVTPPEFGDFFRELKAMVIFFGFISALCSCWPVGFGEGWLTWLCSLWLRNPLEPASKLSSLINFASVLNRAWVRSSDRLSDLTKGVWKQLGSSLFWTIDLFTNERKFNLIGPSFCLRKLKVDFCFPFCCSCSFRLAWRESIFVLKEFFSNGCLTPE